MSWFTPTSSQIYWLSSIAQLTNTKSVRLLFPWRKEMRVFLACKSSPYYPQRAWIIYGEGKFQRRTANKNAGIKTNCHLKKLAKPQAKVLFINLSLLDSKVWNYCYFRFSLTVHTHIHAHSNYFRKITFSDLGNFKIDVSGEHSISKI